MDRALGRRTPTDWVHIHKYSLQIAKPVANVEKRLRLPSWHTQWDQGSEGACVGFGTSMMMSILNEQQARDGHHTPFSHKYNPFWLWNEAKKIDEWSDTNPGDTNGTSVRAGCDILRTLGHVRIVKGKEQPADIRQGIKTNKWASTVDEMRTMISKGVPIAIGVNWYSSFDSPQKIGNGFYIPKTNIGRVRGGHCVCVYGASDERQAFIFKNSWGKDYPLTWVPYSVMEKLLQEDGEATLVTDR